MGGNLEKVFVQLTTCLDNNTFSSNCIPTVLLFVQQIEDHQKMGKGITLTKEELHTLKYIYWWSCYNIAIRIPWTKHEVALLIDACIRFENTICTRTEIIKELSKKLRELALKNDIQIDDIYRNENGISIQFQLMMGLLQKVQLLQQTYV